MEEKARIAEQLEHYLRLPYAIEVVPDSCGEGELCYVATHPELLGCTTHGATVAEALANLREVRELYLAGLLRHGVTPPLPRFSASLVESASTGEMVIWEDLTRAERRPAEGFLISAA